MSVERRELLCCCSHALELERSCKSAVCFVSVLFHRTMAGKVTVRAAWLSVDYMVDHLHSIISAISCRLSSTCGIRVLLVDSMTDPNLRQCGQMRY